MLVIQAPLLTASTLLGELAIFFACVNVFGGFVVTHRMLVMFVPSDDGNGEEENSSAKSKAQ